VRFLNRIQEFIEMLPNKSDEELVDILSHKDQYEPTALQAVRKELDARCLETNRILQLEKEAESRTEEEERTANLPLQWPLRILMLLASFGILQVIFGEYFRSRGYIRRYKECWKWMAFGWLFWLVISISRMV